MGKFTYNSIYVAILAALPYSTAIHAANYTERLDTSSVTLQDGDFVNITQSSKSTVGIWVQPGNPVNIGAGRIDVNVNTPKDNPRGVNIGDAMGNDFGDGTSIIVNGDSQAHNASLGISIVNNSSLVAKNINIVTTGKRQATAISMSGNGSQINLSGNTILSSVADKAATGALLKDNNNLTFEQVNISSESEIASGIILSGDNSSVDLGSGSTIKITSTSDAYPGIVDDSSGILFSDVNGQKKLQANQLDITANGKNSKGIIVDHASGNSEISLGVNSSIITDGEYGTGIEIRKDGDVAINAEKLLIHTKGTKANAIDAYSGNINMIGGSVLTSENAGGIYATSKDITANNAPSITIADSEINARTFGIYSEGANTNINISDSSINTDLDYFALGAASGAVIHANNTSIESKHGIEALSLGKVSFSGISLIKTNAGIALDAGNSGEITGTGNALIDGGIRAYDKSLIALNLDKQSVINGEINSDNSSRVELTLSDKSVWNATNTSSLDTLSLNNSTLYIGKEPGAPFEERTVTIKGNYVGNDAAIYFDTVLGADDSATDKLIIRGDTSGNTDVYVNNVGGHGSQTLEGIKLIHVDGRSDGEFTQSGRIAAGAYDYSLVRGLGTNNGNWYLTSQLNTPVNPDNPQPETPDSPTKHTLRPEGGSYTANHAAVNNMFNMQLRDRSGDTHYTDVTTGDIKTTSMWMRHVGDHQSWYDGSSQLRTQSNRYVMQLGGDIAQGSTNGHDNWRLGIMAGYGHDNNQTRSSATNYTSRGSVNGYSAGLYATWYADNTDHKGLYIDGWAQYGWFDNHVKGEGLASESYKSKGLTASVETGYTYKIGEFFGSQGTINELYIQPQAQVTWMGVKSDDLQEVNGTRIDMNGNDNIQTRLGARTYLKSFNKIDEGRSRYFQPFIEANWIHNTRSFSTKMDDIRVNQEGARNRGEIKLGVEGQITQNFNLWGNVGVQVGDKGYNSNTATLGLKYSF